MHGPEDRPGSRSGGRDDLDAGLGPGDAPLGGQQARRRRGGGGGGGRCGSRRRSRGDGRRARLAALAVGLRLLADLAHRRGRRRRRRRLARGALHEVGQRRGAAAGVRLRPEEHGRRTDSALNRKHF